MSETMTDPLQAHFQRVACHWSVHLGVNLSRADVAEMVRFAREDYRKHISRASDSFLSGETYVAMAAECAVVDDVEDDGYYTAYPKIGRLERDVPAAAVSYRKS